MSLVRSGISAALLLIGLLTAGCGKSEAQPATVALAGLSAKPEVRALHGRCVDAMVRSACVANKDTSSMTAPSSPVVMLAGVGAVDARFYAKLRAAGDGMCEAIVQPCGTAWNGSQCRTARALWPAP